MKLFLATALVFIATLVTAQVTLAQTTPVPTTQTEYSLLAPLPGIVDKTDASNSYTNVATYIPALVKLVIGLAIAAAVLLIIAGGMKYIMSATVGGKGDGRDMIQNAIVGLLLVISSWVILNTINPDLVKFNLQIENVGSNSILDTSQGSTPPAATNPSTGGDTAPTATSAGQDWPPDTQIRNVLQTIGITINKSDCTTVGQSNCTSLDGINPVVVTDLQALKTACNCSITLTGGTEYWLHGNNSTELSLNKTAHRPEGTVADLSLYTNVTDFLRANGTVTTGTSCTVGTERYLYQGSLYVNETIEGNDAHWHVCFQ